MSERVFLNPMDGELHPESYYHRENIDLDCVIEAVNLDGQLAFDIVPDRLERMEFKSIDAIQIIAHFVGGLAQTALNTDDPEEAQELAELATYVSKVMMKKLKQDFTEH